MGVKESIANTTEYQVLSRAVGKDNEIQSALKEAYELLKSAKKSGNEKLYQKFLKEYDDLVNLIKKIKENTKKISKQQRTQVMLELGDLVDLAEDNGVIEAKSLWSYFGDYFKKTDTKDAKSKAESLREKSIEDYSIEEAIGALEYTNRNYKNYKEISDEEKSITFFYNSIEQIDDRYELELFQQKLIEKIKNSGKYPNLYFGYNKEIGYFLVSEQEIINAINSGNIGEISHEILIKFLSKNKDKIKFKISKQGLEKLIIYCIENDDENLKKAIVSLGIIDKKSFITLDKEKIERFKEFFNFDFNNLEPEFFLEFPEYIYAVNDKKKLLEIINFAFGKPLKFSFFSPRVVDIDIIEAYYENTQIQLTSQEIGALPEKCFEFENSKNYEKIAKLFQATNPQAYPLLINRIGISRFRDFINNYDFEDKQKLIKNIPSYYLDGKENEKYETKIEEIIKKQSYSNEDLSYIDDFIGYLSTVKNISIAQMRRFIFEILKKLPNKEKGANAISLMPNLIVAISNDKPLLFGTLRKFPSIFSYLNLKQRSDLDTIKALLEGVNESNLVILRYIELDNGESINNNIINIFGIYKAIKAKFGENKKILNSIFNNPISRAKLYGFLQTAKNEDIKILNTYKKEFEEIEKIIGKLSDETKKLIETYNSNKQNADNLKNIQKEESLEQQIEKITKNPRIAKEVLYFIKSGNIEILKNLAGKITPDQLKKILNIKIKQDTRTIIEESKNIKINPQKITKKSREIFDEKGGLNLEKLKTKLETLLEQNLKINASTPEGKAKLIELFIKTYGLENLPKEEKDKLISILNKQIDSYLYLYVKENPEDITRFGEKDFYQAFYKNFDKIIKQERQITKKVKEELENKKQTSPTKTKNLQEKQNYFYNPENNTIKISIENGQKEIPLSKQDRLAIKENPENLEKIVNFYKVLDRVGLTKLWNIKDKIFIAIQNKYGIGFNLKDGDYLNENEIKIFLNTILKSIGEKEISPVFNLETFLSRIKIINKTQLGGKEAKVNIFGETYIEAKFFEKFVGRNNTIIGFKQSDFEKALK